MKADKFIEKYRKFYFTNTGKENVDEWDEFGIPMNLKQTSEDLENHIINKLNKGCYDVETFAWKAGKAMWDEKNNKFEYIRPLPQKVVNGNGGEIKKNRNSRKMSKANFEKMLESGIKEIRIENFENTCNNIKELYLDILDKFDLYNFGFVNLVNMMFFLTKGAVPIYDYYAHVSIKALQMNVNPREVYVGPSPGKKEHSKGCKKEEVEYYSGMNVLNEYMWLLKEVFPEEINMNGMYISRELDQALWVYGHAYKIHKEC